VNVQNASFLSNVSALADFENAYASALAQTLGIDSSLIEVTVTLAEADSGGRRLATSVKLIIEAVIMISPGSVIVVEQVSETLRETVTTPKVLLDAFRQQLLLLGTDAPKVTSLGFAAGAIAIHCASCDIDEPFVSVAIPCRCGIFLLLGISVVIPLGAAIAW
jgi:hypothetical protein